jgi:hypothetical protein
VTFSGFTNIVLILVLCGVVPGFAVIEEGGPGLLVSEKFTVVRPVAAAVTVRGPKERTVLAVNGAEATPDALVATTIVAVPLLNVPESATAGAVNVTFTPDTGLLPESSTVTASAFAKAVLTVALCGVVPGFAVIVEGVPAVLVNEKFTVVRPDAATVTV